MNGVMVKRFGRWTAVDYTPEQAGNAVVVETLKRLSRVGESDSRILASSLKKSGKISRLSEFFDDFRENHADIPREDVDLLEAKCRELVSNGEPEKSCRNCRDRDDFRRKNEELLKEKNELRLALERQRHRKDVEDPGIIRAIGNIVGSTVYLLGKTLRMIVGKSDDEETSEGKDEETRV